MDRAEALERLAAARVGRLATITPEGKPHLVAVTFALVGDTVVHVVDHKPKRSPRLQRIRNLEAYPVACFLADHYSEDWERLWWVRVDGGAVVIDEGPERERALSALADKYPVYRSRPPTGPVIAVALGEVTWWESRR